MNATSFRPIYYVFGAVLAALSFTGNADAQFSHGSVTTLRDVDHSAVRTAPVPQTQVIPQPTPTPQPAPQRHAIRHHVPVVVRPGFHVHTVHCHYTAGHYEQVLRDVYVGPSWTKRYVPPEYAWNQINGKWYKVLVNEGYYEDILIPAHVETRWVSVWVPESWHCSYY